MESFKFIDTHCHLDVVLRMNFDDLLTQREIAQISETVLQMQRLGISDFVSVGTNLVVSKNSVSLAHAIPGVWATIGLHPTDVHDDWRSDVNEFKKMLAADDRRKIVAVGEIGIDLFRDASLLSKQQDLLKAQIELALEYNRSIVFHIRDHIGVDRSAQHTLEIIDLYGKQIRGVIHCFQQSLDMAQEFVNRGFYLGIDAPIDYPKNEWLRDVVRKIPLRSLVLETDAPFLPPQKLRGQKNTSLAIPYIAEQIALLKNCSIEEVARVTTENAISLFGIDVATN
ncbi:TatD family deoxyribonuclease [Candidatus Dependentiae bacterium]|nr:TatD family deoxyribonuclease [Candidatus Dependentiae bacterium]